MTSWPLHFTWLKVTLLFFLSPTAWSPPSHSSSVVLVPNSVWRRSSHCQPAWQHWTRTPRTPRGTPTTPRTPPPRKSNEWLDPSAPSNILRRQWSPSTQVSKVILTLYVCMYVCTSAWTSSLYRVRVSSSFKLSSSSMYQAWFLLEYFEFWLE